MSSAKEQLVGNGKLLPTIVMLPAKNDLNIKANDQVKRILMFSYPEKLRPDLVEINGMVVLKSCLFSSKNPKQIIICLRIALNLFKEEARCRCMLKQCR